MTKYNMTAHESELSALSFEELCKRLRGEYLSAKYAPETIQAEAARRLEAAIVNQAYDEAGKAMIARLQGEVSKLTMGLITLLTSDEELAKARSVARAQGREGIPEPRDTVIERLRKEIAELKAAAGESYVEKAP